MKKVFAVLFILFFSSCTTSTINKNTNDNTIYSCVGDFDGDSKVDNIKLIKNSNSAEIVFKSQNSTQKQPININFNNFYCNIEDINDDGCDDFIVNSIENNKENIYIFTFKNSITEILSPKIIESNINLLRKGNNYTIECGAFKSSFKSKEELSLNLLYSETDYTEYGKSIITEGVLINRNKLPRYTVSLTYQINSLGKLNFLDITINPYKK